MAGLIFVDLIAAVKSLPQTEKTYWQQPDAKEFEAKVLRVFKEGGDAYLVLDKTVFYPQGGDQLGDTGTIKGKAGNLVVKKVLLSRGVILHWGKISGEIKDGEKVRLEVFWPGRLKHTRTHSLGHLIGSAMWQVNPKIKVVETQMANPAWIKFDGELSKAELTKVENIAAGAIKEKRAVTIRFVDLEELKKICRHVPEKLPATNLRVVQIEGFDAIPCGGTHVKNLSEIGDFKVIRVESAGEQNMILFDLAD